MPAKGAYYENKSLKLKLVYQEHPYLFSLILKAALSCINRGLNNVLFIGRHKVPVMQMDEIGITQRMLLKQMDPIQPPARVQWSRKQTLW